MAAWANGMQLGPYVLLSLIGAGGMGEVWKARDTRLNRIVAIKRLKGRHTSRFEQEARAIAALNHPNICQIYDVGPDYLVMEYIDGKPLSGPLADDEAARLALQIAGALEEAHGKKILHRDLKPGNILVTAKGAAKVLDFGLAKFMADSDATNTMDGTVLGTAAYMSPEQAQGMAVDERSDIFSFGAVMYEILSGRRAFAGSSMAQVLIAVVRDDPAPLQSGRVADVVKRCLAKEAAQRFQSAVEVTAALERVAAKPVVERQPSIAVLPFANMSGDKEQEYFSDGLAEEIINALAQIPDLKVIARTSAFAFKGQNTDVRRIAETLGVSNILEGSVRKAGNRIRITAQLIKAADGSHLWSERFDRELTDVFAVQDEIATAIAGTLKSKLSGKPVVPRRAHTPNLPAYEAFLKGRHYLFKHSPDAIARSREYFEQSLALDPQYPDPYAWLAANYMIQALHGIRPAREVMPLARIWGQKAVGLDPSYWGAYTPSAMVSASYDFDWKAAEQYIARARALGEAEPEVYWTYANFLLVPFGRFRESVEQIEKAVERDPLNVAWRYTKADYLNMAGLYDDALKAGHVALEIDAGYWYCHFAIAETYAAQGMWSEALAAAEKAYELAPWSARATGFLAGLLKRSGPSDRAETLVHQLENAAPIGMAIYHVLCSEKEKAAEWYEKAIEQREIYAIMYAHSALLKPVRESPRWPKLAKMMNLPEAV